VRIFHLQTLNRDMRERLAMVKIFLPDGTAAASRKRWRLLGGLKRADYASSDPRPPESGEDHEEALVIRHMKDVTIPRPGYPASRRRKLNPDQKALASWENEGGAVRMETALR
jgi:hypothetical protein